MNTSPTTLRMTIENAGPMELLVTLDNLFSGNGEHMSFTVRLPYREQTIAQAQTEAIRRARDMLDAVLRDSQTGQAT